MWLCACKQMSTCTENYSIASQTVKAEITSNFFSPWRILANEFKTFWIFCQMKHCFLTLQPKSTLTANKKKYLNKNQPAEWKSMIYIFSVELNQSY